MKNPTSLRISDMTRQQIAELAQVTKLNQTEIVTVAVDRMHRSEINNTEDVMYTKITGNTVLVHGNELVGSIVTNQSLSVEDAIDLLGVSADDYDNYGSLRLISLDDMSPTQRQDYVLDHLQPMTMDEVMEDFGGKSLSCIITQLNSTYPTDDNLQLACEIYRLLQ